MPHQKATASLHSFVFAAAIVNGPSTQRRVLYDPDALNYFPDTRSARVVICVISPMP
jgi:hypothetical protein